MPMYSSDESDGMQLFKRADTLDCDDYQHIGMVIHSMNQRQCDVTADLR